MGLTLNQGYYGGGIYPTLEVTITNGTATSVTATLGSKVVNLTYDSADDIWRGTLKAFGTWTVEATDGDKTVSDTVDVTIVSVYTASLAFGKLPSGYTELEYIESTGTQYIDTNIRLPDKVECKINSLTATEHTYTCIFGCYAPAFNLNFGSTGHWEFNYDTWYTNLGSALNNADYEIVATSGTPLTCSINGQFIVNNANPGTPKSNLDNNGTTYIFALNGYRQVGGSAEAYSYVRGYYFKLWFGGELVRDYVPAKRKSDNEIGMYDLISGTFFSSATSTPFIAGPEV